MVAQHRQDSAAASAGRNGGSPRNDIRLAARFAGVAFGLLVCSYAVFTSELAGRLFTERYCEELARVVRAGLRAAGQRAHGDGPYIVLSDYSMRVITACSALDITAVVAGLMVAFPASWKRKLAGISAAFIVLFAVNLVRIAVLVLLGSRRDAHFDDFHMIYAQGLLILVAIGLWFYWVLNWSAYARPARRRVRG